MSALLPNATYPLLKLAKIIICNNNNEHRKKYYKNKMQTNPNLFFYKLLIIMNFKKEGSYARLIVNYFAKSFILDPES